MTREIKFRGRRADNGEWVYGSLHSQEIEVEKQIFKDGANNHYLGIDVRLVIEVDSDDGPERLDDYLVISETVGQFTDAFDENGKEVYEGDIVLAQGGEHAQGFYEHSGIFVIGWGYFGFIISNVRSSREERLNYLESFDSIAVIGNIYENPEFVKN